MKISAAFSASALALTFSLSVSLGAALAMESVLGVDGGRVAVPQEVEGVYAFKGLPYAAPPVGDLRWRPPVPVIAWSGVRQADRFAPDCMQKPSATDSPQTNARSEDCLYLNVWTPVRKPTKRPVFVWIHGGGSRVGSGAEPQFDGVALAKRGIVVVTINYRLGPFGFLSSSALSAESGYGASGNYGFMDDMAALRWVKRNIAAFGGDPGRVTIGGESSGSVTSSVLMASPMAAGLFQQAIGESGSAFRVHEYGSMGATGLTLEEARGNALAQALGASDLPRLRAIPSEDILAAASKAGAFFNLPVVDGHVLPASPWRMFAEHRQNDVPLLVGWNSDEGSLQLMGPQKPLQDQLESYYGAAAKDLAPYYNPQNVGDVRARIDAAGDKSIAYPTWTWALAQSRFGKRPVYVYQFNRAPPIPSQSFGDKFDVKLAGAFHGAEIPYVFNTLVSKPSWMISDDDRRIANQMSSYWVNFVKTGNPNGASLPPWPTYLAETRPQRMEIGLKTGAGVDPDFKRFMALKAVHERIDPPEPTSGIH
jgi:para-nitrobenzyl esterase